MLGGGGGAPERKVMHGSRIVRLVDCGRWGSRKKVWGPGPLKEGVGAGGGGDLVTEPSPKGWRWLRNQGLKRRIRRCFEKTFPDDVCLKMISASRGSRDPVTPPPIP